MELGRISLGRTIAEVLMSRSKELQQMWRTAEPVRHVVVDGLLPERHAHRLSECFPKPATLMFRSTLRERKRVGINIEKYDPAVGECLFAFQQPEVVRAVQEITDLPSLEADPTLYASGISIMGNGDFLNPHIDNSHNGTGTRYRVLNLLYYLSPNWSLDQGGNLELWEPTVSKGKTILAAFNRLVVMETNQTSWHSVNQVTSNAPRYCSSNYYFSPLPPGGMPYSHVTTFQGRPEEFWKRIVLQVDGTARNILGRTFPSLLQRTKHVRRTS